MPAPWKTHGTGEFERSDLGAVGSGVVIESGVLVYNPAHVFIGADVYLGHGAMLKGDTRAELVIGDGSWIGERCYLHSAGGIRIGREVGLAPYAMVLTSTHAGVPRGTAIIDGPLELEPVEVGDGADVGLGAILLPGTRLGAGVLVGAGAVVKGEFADYSVIAGVPARIIGTR